MLFMRALVVESSGNFRRFYSSAEQLIRSPFEDRLDLFMSKDIDESTNCKDVW